MRDVFNAFMVRGAEYDGEYDLPKVRGTKEPPPKELIAFDKAFKSKEYHRWIHFYIDDYKFSRIWNKPKKYLSFLKKYQGVISPDFSIYRDMPLVMQIENTYRNRALSYWYEQNGIPVIPNVRWGNKESYDFCFAGLPKNSMLAVGTHGALRYNDNRRYFYDGLREMIDRLTPHTLIVYGCTPKNVFVPWEWWNIKIVRFDNQIALTHKKAA